ncbi:hypothetical protein SAMN03159371_00832 [Variovorax sp. NFACC28]|nr:hypothetical protein SAMN03159371_00832 [Variovorax sp. NFACC28]SEG09561.1 hypothetical protein SAMN03159365_01409 [Variovorax sp. NFACC29]SFC03918.1 hypothetical protein SAMN03159379_01408 [Variovorax sp. NFACC26]SFF77519.1 hypothetical protein SAMN03159447_00015 [Variovorax sp. NFACC27]
MAVDAPWSSGFMGARGKAAAQHSSGTPGRSSPCRATSWWSRRTIAWPHWAGFSFRAWLPTWGCWIKRLPSIGLQSTSRVLAAIRARSRSWGSLRVPHRLHVSWPEGRASIAQSCKALRWDVDSAALNRPIDWDGSCFKRQAPGISTKHARYRGKHSCARSRLQRLSRPCLRKATIAASSLWSAMGKFSLRTCSPSCRPPQAAPMSSSAIRETR